jgi:hypothetical protein
MPDFTKQIYFHCRSVESCIVEVQGSTGKTYKVHRGRTRTAQNDWICECKGFKFRGTCKHVKQARSHPDYCGWQEFIDGGEPVKQPEGGFGCPECGGQAIALEYAV